MDLPYTWKDKNVLPMCHVGKQPKGTKEHWKRNPKDWKYEKNILEYKAATIQEWRREISLSYIIVCTNQQSHC